MTTIDKKIEDLLDIVRLQKSEVERVEKSSKRSWNTHCSFKLLQASVLNIQTANEDAIVRALTELLFFKNNFKEANQILGLNKTIKHDGYSVEEWIEDFQKRIATLQLKNKKDRLKILEERLNSIVSPEQRRQMELEAIMKDLSE